ncbi:MAG: hypothetical protein K2X11_22225 [Acetobacteraceae bacterium]|nr:hypothetical protein [Acetobacteraceae bacterium]
MTPGRRILWTNLLFGAGLALILPWLAAGLLAHRWGPARGTLWSTHHAYAVRTFWIGLVGAVGALAAHTTGAMEPLLALTWLWCAARVTRGFLAWEREEWIADPGRFL